MTPEGSPGSILLLSSRPSHPEEGLQYIRSSPQSLRCLVTSAEMFFVPMWSGWQGGRSSERHGVCTTMVKNTADKTNSRLPPALSCSPHLHAALYLNADFFVLRDGRKGAGDDLLTVCVGLARLELRLGHCASSSRWCSSSGEMSLGLLLSAATFFRKIKHGCR